MNRGDKTGLLLMCGDKRFNARELGVFEQKLGYEPYKLVVPGPDAGVKENTEHLSAVLFLAKYFFDLMPFDELVVVTHEDCKGCQCEYTEHEQHALSLIEIISGKTGFTGSKRCFTSSLKEIDLDQKWDHHELKERTAKAA